MRKQREQKVSEYIMEALFDLMKKKRYEAISITEITNRAGVGRISFYRNFSSKEDIITKWIDEVTDLFLKESGISYKNDSTKDYFIKLFTHLEKWKEQSILIYISGLDYLLKKKFDDVFINNYDGKYDAYRIYFVSGGIYNIYYYWISNGCKETAIEIANKLFDLIVKL